MKRFYEIKLPNKSYKVVVEYNPGSIAIFEYVYNSISGGYMGLSCDTFVESLRGLLRVQPDFFERIGHDYKKDLAAMGFVQIEAPERDAKLWTLAV